MASGRRENRGWLRAVGLLCLTLALAIVSVRALIAVPFILMAFALPPHRAATLFLASAFGLLVFADQAPSGLWFAERGWALMLGGWFVALTLRWPSSGFTNRSLGAVAGAFVAVAAILAVRPGAWVVVSWQIGDRIQQGVSSALDALRLMQGGDVSETLVNAVYQTASAQETIFPALLALTSMSALGVAWWLYVRLARGSDQGLAPLRDFRFSDQFVWLLIAGLVPVAAVALEATFGSTLWPGAWGEPPVRFGTNALVFMGALYALRGVAVVLFLYGGLNLIGMIVFVVGLLFVAPVIAAGAMVIGIGDTWLDLRTRARPEVPEGH